MRKAYRRGTIRKIRIVQTEGNRQVERNVAFYALEAIIAVGYRVNSEQATRFRQWTTKTLDRAANCHDNEGLE
ncbi:MAG: virulence RhuM family protein [Prevotella histicola]|nr:RhuM family protein [Prevotella histicola]MBF1425442.1 virulence RhuM family protein [Prevotella histicola]